MIHCCPRLNVRVHSSKVERAAAGVHQKSTVPSVHRPVPASSLSCCDAHNKAFMANSTSWHWYLDSDSNKMIALYAVTVFFLFLHVIVFTR